MRKPPFDGYTAAAWLLVLIAICVQFRIGWLIWGSDLAGADDPAHFTTGVMVYEYFRHALFSNPIEFARSFYIRFPKLAIGHWPPVYYALQAVMYAVAGPTIRSARVLSEAICFAVAYLLFERVRSLHGVWIGALCAGCFLVLPLVQGQAWLVMSDLLVALFMFLAAISFADFLDSAGPRDAVWFVVWSTLAILTKGSGWALGLFALFAPLLARRGSCFRNKWYWGSGILIGLLSAPFFWWTQRLQVGYPADPVKLASGSIALTTRFGILTPVTSFVPWLVFLIAAAGLVSACRKGLTTIEAAALALIVSQVVFLLILPLTGESRYYMPSAAAIMLFFARGLTWPRGRLVPLALAATTFAVCGFGRVERVDGYRAAVDSIPYRLQASAILVGSDAPGEGAFIAERLDHDLTRTGVVLRGSKVLAISGWSGEGYRPIFQSPAEILDYLRSVPVRYIVIDQSAKRAPHLDLLERTVESAPDLFVLKGRFAISGSRNGEVLVFENPRAGERSPSIHLNLGSRALEYKE